jgi:hypothetical protein
MGEKKKKEVAQKKWKKVLFIILAVLFVVVMVVSSMGSNWISGLAPVKAGDQVVIDYTIYDAAGNPVMTSSQQVYNQVTGNGQGIMYAKQITLTANQSLKQAIYPVQAYVGDPSNGNVEGFALYNPEYNAISRGVVGMRTNDKKTVALTSNNTMNALFTPEDLAKGNVNISAIEVGESLAMGVSETPNVTVSNTSAVTYIRLGEVTRKTPTGVVVDFGYPSAEITVVSVTKQ